MSKFKSKSKESKKIYFKGIKKHLTLRNALIAILFLFAYLIFSNVIKAVILLLLFIPPGTFSIQITRVMPNMNAEIISPLGFLLGYLYGGPVGAFYGVVLGAYMWARYYSISQFVLLHLFLNGIVAFVGGYLASSFPAMTFLTAYFVGMAIRDILFFILGALMGSPIENTIQTITTVFVHMIIMPSFMVLIYKLVTLI